jgi:hypothetical protein
VALWANVTSLLEISYGKMAGLRAGWRGGGKKIPHILSNIFQYCREAA